MAESTRVRAERKLICIMSPFEDQVPFSEEIWRFSGGEREIGEAKHADVFALLTLIFGLVCFL